MPLPASSDGLQDMFFKYKWGISEIGNYCTDKYGVEPLPAEFSLKHGGLDLKKATSKLILTNGYLDPWMPGGYNKSQSKDILFWMVEQGAHHLDLREDHEGDPKNVRDVRDSIEATIGTWLEELTSDE